MLLFATNYSVFSTLSSVRNVFLVLFCTHYHPNVFSFTLRLCHCELVSLSWNGNYPFEFPCKFSCTFKSMRNVICQKRLMKQLHYYETNFIANIFLFVKRNFPDNFRNMCVFILSRTFILKNITRRRIQQDIM